MHVRIRRVLATAAAGVLLAVGSTGTAHADWVTNDVDASIDASVESLPLTVGASDTVELWVENQNRNQGDSLNSCNLNGTSFLNVDVVSSEPTVSMVTPANARIEDCGPDFSVTLTVKALEVGSSTISVSRGANSNANGTFHFDSATFVVAVTAPVATNTPPVVGVTGFTDGDTFELGVEELPTPGCSVQDAEDTGASTEPQVASELDAYGLGTTTVTCEYTDTGEETASASASYSTVDTLAPVITRIGVTPAPNDAGWNNTAVTATWTCTDVGTGVVSDSASATTEGEGIDLPLGGTCTDHAGNSKTDSVEGVNVDMTDPEITIGRSTAANAAGWNNGDVTIAWTCEDDLSGPTDLGGSTLLSDEGSGQSVTGTCTDLAGNTAQGTVSDIHIDKTDPSLAWTGPIADGSEFYFGSVPPTPGCTASDDLSGLDGSCAVSGYGTSVGAHTITATAVDKAGNDTVLSSTYEVRAWTMNGYYKPVDMGDVLNTVKNGSTVPLKFEVFAGPTELTSTTAIGAGFTVKGIACPGEGAVTDDIGLTTTGGTSFRYDTTGGQFIQNWQTPKKAGACYEVVTTLADGSSISAKFLLK